MAAVLTKAAAQALTDANEKARKRALYEGSSLGAAPNPPALATVIADYQRMVDALAAVKADGAYAGLDGATKTLVDAGAPYA